MSERDRKRLKDIQSFPALVKYLRDDLGWPVNQDSFDDLDEITFDWEADELGIDPGQAAKIDYIKQLRPLENGQPQGVFFVKFNNKNLPVVALRRLLGKLVVKKRATAAAAERPLWAMRDLVFISSYGESDERQLSFAYFQDPEHKSELPSLKVLGWDDRDTPLHLDHVHDSLTKHLRWPDSPKALPMWRKGWSAAFVLKHGQVVSTAKDLADQLAALARGIRERANQLLKLETETGPLRTLMAGFKTALIHDLTEDQFADMYAQTIAYGLLSARITHPDPVQAETLPDLIPVTNPFLKELMETFVLAGGKHRGRKRGHHLDFDELGINEVVDLLRRANMQSVLENFGNEDRKEDPVTYFYEDFLKAYDPKERKTRGVYYTPKPVVAYIVRSVHELLQTEFGIEDGLASTITWGEMAKRHTDLAIPKGVVPDSPFVQILDPATGTATFLVEVIDVILATLRKRWKDEGLSESKQVEAWNAYVPRHLLPRLYGYELMMAPYAIAHLKIGLKLFETGYRFGSDERARIYLTNALEPASDDSYSQIDALSEALAHEANAVNVIKKKKRFTVVIGNPPYSGHSANNGPWIQEQIEDYLNIEGEPLKESNTKWLRDDYVKFIRFGQRLLTESNRGLFSFITNHGYIDNPTFRGMRASILADFAKCWFVDLHGNLKKQEKAEGGGVDENVFDIQQGVAVFMFERGPANPTERWHGHLRGTREVKYRRLLTEGIEELAGSKVSPTPPFYLFAPQSNDVKEEYSRYLSLTDAAAESSLGILTKRDSLAVAFTRDELQSQVTRFVDSSEKDIDIAEAFGLPLSDKDRWDLKSARRTVGRFNSTKCRRLLYRPFDMRWVYYDETLVARMNQRVLRHLDDVPNNVAIVVGRQGMATGAESWDVCFVSKSLADQNIYRRGGGTVLPLLLAPTVGALDLQDSHLNFSDRLIGSFKNVSSQPRRIFDYIYGVLNSTSYRSRYAEFLGIDFPRVPMPGNVNLFNEIVDLGGELAALHMLESPDLDVFITTYTGPKNPEVGRVGWSDDTVWLDAAATKKGHDATAGSIGFHGVPETVWNFHIGGYQVCEKWLKDRKGRKLLKADIEHYQRIVVALSETIRIMKEIDEVIDQHGGWPGAFRTGDGATGQQH